VRRESSASRAWSAWTRTIVRRRFLGVAAAAVVLGLLIAPVFGIRFGDNSLSALAQTGPAHQTLVQLEQGGVGTGVLTPLEVLVQAPAATAVAARLSHVPGITTVAVPTGPTGTRAGYTDLIAVPSVASLNNTDL